MAARAGMGFRGMVVTALAALLLCGASLAAPATGGAGGDMPRDMGGGSDAAGLEEELHVGAAELAAVPAESRALCAKVLGRLEGMHGEMEELRAERRRSDERIARLEERKDCEGEEKEDEVEQEAKTAQPTKLAPGISTSNTTHRRAQAAPQACARVQDFQALSVAAMVACCPASG